MKFKFRLERVLDFTKLKETTKKMEVAFVAGELNRLQVKKVAIQEDSRRLLEETATKLRDGSEWVPYHVSQVECHRREIIRIDQKIVETEQALEEKKYELARISMRRKALENLKDKRNKEFRLEESRREQKQADELYQIFNTKGD